MVDRMSYLEVTLEGKIQVQQVLPLLEDPVEVPPGRPEALGHGAVDLGPGLLGEDHLVRLPQQLLHRALLAVQRRDHINLGSCLGMIIHCSFIQSCILALLHLVSPDSAAEPPPRQSCFRASRTLAASRARAAAAWGPIRGEHCGHVTSSPPITAHLGSCLGPLCSSAMTSLVPPDCTAMVLRVVVSLLSLAAAAVPTPVFILPEGVHTVIV